MAGKITIANLIEAKQQGRKVVAVSCYDYTTARLVAQTDVEMILVGDSLANVVLGLKSTTELGMLEMLHHAKAVTRAVKHALVVGDMPYDSYQVNPEESLKNAARFITEAKCDAVKLEWFDRCLEVTEKIIQAGIPVMGHIGLTPQTAEKQGGFKVQGKDAQAASRLIEQAISLEKLGCFSLVLECVPDKIAELITKKLKVPTIGIGAGADMLSTAASKSAARIRPAISSRRGASAPAKSQCQTSSARGSKAGCRRW